MGEGVARLSDPLTRAQAVLLESGRIALRVDVSGVYPGCFVAELDGCSAAGSTAKLALEGLLSRLRAAKG